MFCAASSKKRNPGRTSVLVTEGPDSAATALSQSSTPEQTAQRLVQELTFWEASPLQTRAEANGGDSSSQDNGRRQSSRSPIDQRTKLENASFGMNLMEQSNWKRTVDPISGRTYYYHAITRQTQWDKPAELKDIERRIKSEKRRQDRIFFKEMEENIYRSLQRKEFIPGVEQSSPYMMQHPPVERVRAEPSHVPATAVLEPPRVRTISGMDEILVEELSEKGVEKQVTRMTTTVKTTTTVVRPTLDAHGRPPLPTASSSRRSMQVAHSSSLELSPDDTSRLESREDTSELAGERLLDAPITDGVDVISEQNNTTMVSKAHMRRNTGGSIFVKTTMNNPDVGSILKCVCAVYRAHVVQAMANNAESSPVSTLHEYSETSLAFQDHSWDYPKVSPVPSLEEITAFYKDFYHRSQMEHDTIIMSLIYVERLIKEGTIAPMANNWKSILLSCMVLASKVWDDLSMWNVDFSNVCGRGRGGGLSEFTLARINQLELALLKALNFNVKVPASEYARYYFLIRSMLLKSGNLEETRHHNEVNNKPLDMAGAKNLETLSAGYQSGLMDGDSRRTHSLSDFGFCGPERSTESNAKRGRSGPALKQSVCLEQLVTMNR